MRISDWSSDVCSSDLGGMMSGSMMEDMRSIRSLLANHEKVERRVEDIPNGVRTVTTSDDPEVAALIRRHVRQMAARYDRDRPIRMMDPVFRELFRNRDRASLAYKDIPGASALPTRPMTDRKSTRLNSSHKCATSMPT